MILSYFGFASPHLCVTLNAFCKMGLQYILCVFQMQKSICENGMQTRGMWDGNLLAEEVSPNVGDSPLQEVQGEGQSTNAELSIEKGHIYAKGDSGPALWMVPDEGLQE